MKNNKFLIFWIFILGLFFSPLALSHTQCRDLRGVETHCSYHQHYRDSYYSYPIYEFRVDFSNKKLRRKINQVIYRALNGHVKSQSLLSNYYKKGFGVRRSFAKAYAWLKVASESGYKTAQYKLDNLKPNLSPETIEEGERIAADLIPKIKSYQEERERMFDFLHTEEELE